ncbi:hypothetical protein ETN89_19920 (plasmid) [Photobacterium damselae subsp. damselae]|uniref:VirB3 family type IV secretion system protein n=1 Tax=Photobacterium damselae TaxID=38293 RepID=UPI000A2FA811|nr:hypothetical protein CAY62_21160 [Photobacterium damselae subsp. damselae]QAY37531.1 hypothetical protein ETN89_19920 [Photobacterium damselae subsp. damselae]
MEKNTYVTYNALARKSLVWGVPLILGIILLASIILSLFLAVLVSSLFFVVTFLLVAFVFFIKFTSESDSMAFDKVKWTVKGGVLRLKHLSYKRLDAKCGIDNPKRKKERINDFFKQYNG